MSTSPLPDDIREALSHAAERLGSFARPLVWYPDVTSTNDQAAALADAGAPEGTVVAADAQSAGRGRRGRQWVSPAGAGLYVSTVLRPPPHVVSLLTIAAGVAVAEGIEVATGLRPALKWPNDLYAGSRKLAGLLAEANVGTSVVQYVVLGIGVNVMPAPYPHEIAGRSTSLEAELGRAVDRALLLAECLAALASRYADLKDGRERQVLAGWRARAAATLGRKVRWEADGPPVEGTADSIDETGALLVRTPTGTIRITSGEVVWL
jgi:BirA family transcriptional regulator, biotin operon repressor / biotin---[acetyl-CoA-carboxylase] ligase